MNNEACYKSKNKKHSKFFLVENGNMAILQNDLVAFEFDFTVKGFGAIKNIISKISGVNFIVPFSERFKRGTFWELDFRDEGGKSYIIKNTTDAQKTYEYELDEASRTIKLILKWLNVSPTGGPENIDVKCVITLPYEHGIANFRIVVDNKNENLTLWKVRFPMINSIGFTGNQNDIQFMIPEKYGRLIKGYKNFHSYRGNYPNGWGCTMQVIAIHYGNSGLYLAAHDPEGRPKQFILEPDIYCKISQNEAAPLDYCLVNYPEAMTFPKNSFNMSYDFALGVFQGDWYDAAKIYKNWANNEAKWCKNAHGIKKDSWINEVDFWLLVPFSEEDINRQLAEAPERIASEILKYKEYINETIAVHWYNWHVIPFDTDYPEYFPTKIGFEETVRMLQNNGVYVMPYINGRIWDINSSSWSSEKAERYCAKRSGPRLRPKVIQNYIEWYGSEQLFAPMCPYTEFWQDKVTGIVERLVKEVGVAGVYIDEVAAAPAELCFDQTHGHSTGGGSYWVEGYGRMVSKIRGKTNDINPNLVLTTECFAEPYLAMFDGFLTWGAISGEQIPLFQVIYSNYIASFGRSISERELKDVNAYAIKVGEQFVFGIQLGWYSLPTLEKCKEKYKLQLDYLRKLIKARKAARRFLVEGEMLRPMKLESSLPEVKADIFFHVYKYEAIRPSILTSAWSLGDNTIALLATNISPSSHFACYSLNFNVNWDPEKIKYKVIGGSGDVRVKYINKEKFMIDLYVPAYDALVAEISV